jgi:hypothetical protein
MLPEEGGILASSADDTTGIMLAKIGGHHGVIQVLAHRFIASGMVW